MAAVTIRILPLPADVIAQIKSSTTITSLTGAVLELVRNSLDADACKVDIIVDFPRGSCTVEDDGLGILPAEFREEGGLGKLHNTSKYDDAKPVYGRNGAFLYSLAAVSLVSITSRHASYSSYCTINFHRSRIIARLVPAPPHYHLSAREHGTRVTVRDMFGNMPVRVRQRAVAFHGHEENTKEWINLKKGVVALLLALGRPITVIAKDADGNIKLTIRGPSSGPLLSDSSPRSERSHSFKPASVRSILSQAAYISPSDWGFWVVTSARTISMTVRGVFSLQPGPSKHVQFISIGIRPTLAEGAGNELYDSINRIFASSSFGILDNKPATGGSGLDGQMEDRRVRSNGATNKQLKGGGKGVDRWPMFYVQVDLHSSEQWTSTVEDAVITNEQSLKTIIDVVSEMTTQFLKEHHFRLGRKRPKRMAKPSRRVSMSSMSSRPTSLPLKASDHTPVRAGIASSAQNPQKWTDSGSRLPNRPASPYAGATEGANDHNRRPERLDSPKVNHVRIPSFPHPRRNDSEYMLNSWSRIKAGKRDITEDVCAGLPTSKGPKRPSQHPSGSGIERVFKKSGAGRLPMLKVLEGSDHLARGLNEGVLGEISRISPCVVPAETLEESLPEPSTEALFEPAEVEQNGTAADEILLWTNPVSKATLAINSRTGIVVPPRANRPFSAPNAVGLSARSGDFRSSLRRSFSSLAHTQTDFRTPPKESWLERFLESWDNPVFQQTEVAIPHVQMCEIIGDAAQTSDGRGHHCLQNDNNAVLEHRTASLSGKLSKDALKHAEIIAQVDAKFILIKMEADSTSHVVEDSQYINRRLLVLVDQHAADERCRIEGLMAELCRPPAPDSKLSSNLGNKSHIITTPLSKRITFPVSVLESDLFRLHTGHFADWGILYDVVDCLKSPAKKGLESERRIVIKNLPPVIAERCKLEPAQLISLLRGEVWNREGKGPSARVRQSPPAKVPVETSVSQQAEDSELEEHSWLRRIGDCPQGILNMLNSRACRSAIMFNDQLSREQCQTLILKLAQCAFPFQCAHGRPSMIPLVDLGGFGQETLRGTALDAFGEYPTGGEAEQPPFVEALSKWKGL